MVQYYCVVNEKCNKPFLNCRKNHFTAIEAFLSDWLIQGLKLVVVVYPMQSYQELDSRTHKFSAVDTPVGHKVFGHPVCAGCINHLEHKGMSWVMCLDTQFLYLTYTHIPHSH